MIINPPNIVCLLKDWQRLRAASGFSDARVIEILATYFHLHSVPMDWPQFKRTYQLYLQSIPFATAREAWGLIQAGNPKH